jgi:hypothetical protein
VKANFQMYGMLKRKSGWMLILVLDFFKKQQKNALNFNAFFY